MYVDIGVVDPQRLRHTLTPDEMRRVRWNALIEVKFRGLHGPDRYEEIKCDLRKLGDLREDCDRAYVIVVEELPPFDPPREEVLRATAAAVDVGLRFVRAAR